MSDVRKWLSEKSEERFQIFDLLLSRTIFQEQTKADLNFVYKTKHFQCAKYFGKVMEWFLNEVIMTVTSFARVIRFKLHDC